MGAKTGLEHDIKLLIEKIKSSKKIVVVVVVNYDVLARYQSALEVAEGIENKWQCCCLDTLVYVAMELAKRG